VSAFVIIVNQVSRFVRLRYSIHALKAYMVADNMELKNIQMSPALFGIPLYQRLLMPIPQIVPLCYPIRFLSLPFVIDSPYGLEKSTIINFLRVWCICSKREQLRWQRTLWKTNRSRAWPLIKMVAMGM
jgi:hypothetical protein